MRLDEIIMGVSVDQEEKGSENWVLSMQLFGGQEYEEELAKEEKDQESMAS